MAEKTKIEWTESTWNPIRGVKGKWHCSKVSPGCKNCYAERINKRFNGPEYIRDADSFRIDDKIMSQPLRWKRPRSIFVCSMTDLFHHDLPMGWIAYVFAIMGLASHHKFQILTKRSERMRDLTNKDSFISTIKRWQKSICMGRGIESNKDSFKWPIQNVMLGVSVEDQERADERIPFLLQSSASIRFVSVEPLLSQISLGLIGTCPKSWGHGRAAIGSLIDWVIVGSESGHGRRECKIEWVRSLRDQCQSSGVPFFLKQLHIDGKKVSVPAIDGRQWMENPAVRS